jgi:hypothetical protein
MPSFEYRDRAKYIEQCCYDGAARSVFDYHKGRHTCKLHLRRCQDNLPTDTTSWRQVLATHFSNTGYALPTATTTADVGQTDKKPPASEETYANDDQASDFNLVLKNGVAAHNPFKGAFETNSLPSRKLRCTRLGLTSRPSLQATHLVPQVTWARTRTFRLKPRTIEGIDVRVA